MIIEMQEGISPLCDRHYRVMDPTLFEAKEVPGTRFFAYMCRVASCGRCYNSVSGYYDVTDRFKFDFGVRVPCPEDQTQMYLGAVDGSTQTWRCAQLHCKHSQTVQVAA